MVHKKTVYPPQKKLLIKFTDEKKAKIDEFIHFLFFCKKKYLLTSHNFSSKQTFL